MAHRGVITGIEVQNEGNFAVGGLVGPSGAGMFVGLLDEDGDLISDGIPLAVSGAVFGASDTPSTLVVELDASGIEYAVILPAPVYGFDLRPSGAYALKIAFATGDIGAERYTIVDSGTRYVKEFMRAQNGMTVYIASEFDSTPGGEASRGAQVVAWTE